MSAAAIRQIAEQASLPEAIVREALDWLVLSWSGETTPEQQQSLDRWIAADPRHDKAWCYVQRLNDKLTTLPGNLAADSLRAVDGAVTRRNLLLALGLVAVGGSAVPVLYSSRFAQRHLADLRTGTGEIRAFTLADGTELTLNTASAVDVSFDSRVRRLRLIDGEILIVTAADPLTVGEIEPRPFIVETADGSVRPIGTRFTVRRIGEATNVAVIEGEVVVSPEFDSTISTRLAAGQAARLSVSGIEKRLVTNAAAWADGRLVVEQMPLVDFLAELSRYRNGIIRCHPNAADLRVSGSFSVLDTDHTLSVLTKALPIRLTSLTRYWVSVEAR